jgi:hypothetical protein
MDTTIVSVVAGQVFGSFDGGMDGLRSMQLSLIAAHSIHAHCSSHARIRNIVSRYIFNRKNYRPFSFLIVGHKNMRA